MDIRSITRGFAWVVGGLLLACITLYAALVVINWRDEAPSADVHRFEALERDRPVLPDGDNAYVHALGIAATGDTDPVALGARRRAWFERPMRPGGDATSHLMPGQDRDYRAMRAPAIEALSSACSESDRRCFDLLQSDPGALEAWRDAEGWLLDRYRTMLGRTQWRESIPASHLAQLPPYQHLLEAQKLHLLDAWRSASAGDAAAAGAALQQDLAFWRAVLASSDLLITKMIATAAVNRHFAIGNRVLRELPAERIAESTPAAWRTPLTLAERSLSRTLAGEWRFARSVLRDASVQHDMDGLVPGNRVTDVAWRPLFLPQATSNRHAGRMAQLGAASEVDYPDLGRALDALDARWQDEYRPFRLYNPVGGLLDAMAPPSIYRDYVVRTSDLEGMRRAALLVTELRSSGVTADAAARAAANSALRDPYRGAGFGWDARKGAVVFDGLAKAPRGRALFVL